MMRGVLTWCLPLLVALPAWAQDLDIPRSEALEPLSLEVCRAYARANSPSLERQRLTYSNRVESVTIAKTKFDPVLSLRRSWEDTDDPGRTTGTVRQTLPADLQAEFSARTEERDGESVQRYALQLSKVILGGGSGLESRLPIDRARVREAVQANTLSLEERRLMLTVTRRYFAVVRSQLTLRLRELQLKRARTNLEHAEVREDPLDIATAKLRVPESEQDVLRSEREIAEGLLALKETMGMPLVQPLNVITEREFEVVPFDAESDLERALREHEDIRNARLELELARKELRVADTQTLPEVRLEASYEENDPDRGAASQARAEVVLEWPWLDRADRGRGPATRPRPPRPRGPRVRNPAGAATPHSIHRPAGGRGGAHRRPASRARAGAGAAVRVVPQSLGKRGDQHPRIHPLSKRPGKRAGAIGDGADPLLRVAGRIRF